MLVVIISGRANPYTKFYTDWTKDITLQNIEPLVGDPQLTRGTDQKKDFENMAENGYVMLGYTSFSGADVDEEDAIKQAKKINASKAIVYKTYTNSVTPPSFRLRQESDEERLAHWHGVQRDAARMGNPGAHGGL